MSAGPAVISRPDVRAGSRIVIAGWLAQAARDLYDGQRPRRARLILRLCASPRLPYREVMRLAGQLGECLIRADVLRYDPQADRVAGDPVLEPEEIEERLSETEQEAEAILGVLLCGDRA